MIITLVVTLIVDGHDLGRHEKMTSIEACFMAAQKTVAEMLSVNHNDVTFVGAGCTIEKGEPL